MGQFFKLTHCPRSYLWFAFFRLHAIPMWEQWAVAVSSFIALPVMAFHFIEQPMIGLGIRLSKRIG